MPVTFLFCYNSQTATLSVGNVDGFVRLFGVTSVEVQGGLYYVSFQEGTCADLFGCSYLDPGTNKKPRQRAGSFIGSKGRIRTADPIIMSDVL